MPRDVIRIFTCKTRQLTTDSLMPTKLDILKTINNKLTNARKISKSYAGKAVDSLIPGFNLLASELFFLILAHSVYKM